MDPDSEIIKKLIIDSFRASTDSMIPAVYVYPVIGVLCSVVTLLWGLFYKFASTAAENIKKDNTEHRKDIDDREEKTRLRYKAVIDDINDKHVIESDKYEKRIKRVEAARDMIRTQYDTILIDGQKVLLERLAENTTALGEACDINEIILPILRDRS